MGRWQLKLAGCQKISSFFFGRLPLLTILDGDKIPINIFLGWGQVKILKIIFSPYFVNISDVDKIPNDMIFGWGQDRDFENYLVPILSKYF